MAEEQQGEGEVVVDGGRAITLQDLHDMQAEHRAEVAALRDEIAKQRTTPAAVSQNAPSAEEALAARMAEIENHPFYCPGCGRLYNYQRECVGTGTAPHPPIDVVSTDELKSGDESKHTAAPSITT